MDKNIEHLIEAVFKLQKECESNKNMLNQIMSTKEDKKNEISIIKKEQVEYEKLIDQIVTYILNFRIIYFVFL
jgi:hypothetical protein